MPTITSSAPPTARRKRPRLSSTARGYGAEHRRLRKAVLADSPICVKCRERFATDLHHADGNNRNTSAENLLPWCAQCHNAHHADQRRS